MWIFLFFITACEDEKFWWNSKRMDECLWRVKKKENMKSLNSREREREEGTEREINRKKNEAANEWKKMNAKDLKTKRSCLREIQASWAMSMNYMEWINEIHVEKCLRTIVRRFFIVIVHWIHFSWHEEERERGMRERERERWMPFQLIQNYMKTNLRLQMIPNISPANFMKTNEKLFDCYLCTCYWCSFIVCFAFVLMHSTIFTAVSSNTLLMPVNARRRQSFFFYSSSWFGNCTLCEKYFLEILGRINLEW